MTLPRSGAVIAALAVVGLAVAGYLTWVHYAEISPICTGISNCERVQTSKYAEFAGVPVAVIGLVGYASILAALKLPGEAGRMGVALLSYVGLGFSLWLTYLELFKIDAICQWCVISAVVMTAIAVVATLRAARA